MNYFRTWSGQKITVISSLSTKLGFLFRAQKPLLIYRTCIYHTFDQIWSIALLIINILKIKNVSNYYIKIEIISKQKFLVSWWFQLIIQLSNNSEYFSMLICGPSKGLNFSPLIFKLKNYKIFVQFLISVIRYLECI